MSPKEADGMTNRFDPTLFATAYQSENLGTVIWTVTLTYTRDFVQHLYSNIVCNRVYNSVKCMNLRVHHRSQKL